MAGIGTNILSLFGNADPEQEIADWANREQARNRAAAGMDAAGNILPPPANGQTAVGAGAITPDSSAIALNQTGVMQPGQVPQAVKSEPSMGALMMQLQRSDEQSQGLNQALGMGFAAFAQPRDREMVSKMFNVDQPNPTQIGQAQMQAASAQQGQDRTNALGQQVMDPKIGPAMANRLNISWDELKARFQADPAGVGHMIEGFAAPTDTMKNLEQIKTYQDQFRTAHPDATQSELDSIAKAITAGMGGQQAEQMLADQRAFREKFGHDPTWKDNPDGYKSYMAQQGARTDALGIRATSEDKVNDLEGKVDAIKNDPALPGLMKRLVPGQGILSLVGYNDAERNLLQKIKQATSDEYVRGLADPGLGTRKTQQEMQYVGQSLGGVLNASNLSIEDYKAGLGRLQDQLYRTHADIYGQSGSFKGLDPKYYGYINDVYRKGGALNEGIEDAPDRMPLDDEAKQFWQTNVAKGVSKAALIEHLRNLNYDTTGLK